MFFIKKTLHYIFAKKRSRRLPLLFTEGLTDFLQFVRTIFRLFPDILADENRGLGLRGQDNAVAWPGIDLDELRVDLILRAKDDPGEVGVTAKRIDHDPLDLDVKSVENETDQFVGERPFVVLSAHRHGNRPANARFHMDDKTLLLVPDKYSQGVLISGKYAKNLNPHDIRVHILEVPPLTGNDNVVTV